MEQQFENENYDKNSRIQIAPLISNGLGFGGTYIWPKGKKYKLFTDLLMN
jgi:hypothetical protein